MTETELNTKIDQAKLIQNPIARSKRISAITNAYYTLAMLEGERGDTMLASTRSGNTRCSIHDADYTDDAIYAVAYGMTEGHDDAYTPETPVEPMVAQGGNTAWLDAITLAEINNSVEGVQRTYDVRTARNVSATRVRTRAKRAKQADTNKARIAKRQKVQAKKIPKAKQRRAVAIPPSKR